MALGTASRSNVSGYIRNRVQSVNVFAPEVRELVANMNGSVSKAAKIVSANWNTWNNASVFMSTPTIAADQRSVSVLIKAQYSGRSVIRCVCTFDTGEVMPVQYSVQVNAAPLYESDNSWVSGPTTLNVVWV